MEKPAIILITCDELNKDVLGCYGGGAIRTPNIDSLSECGTTYESCYTVSPWCLPARCSILTGKYPHHSGAYSNFRKCALDQEMDNLFFAMKRGTYHTTMFGKCHFAPVPYSQTRADKTLPYDSFKEYYKSLGIDHLELEDDKQVSVWFYDDYSKELEGAGYLEAYRNAVWNREYQKVFPFPGPKEWHPDVWTGQKALSYIKNYKEDKPLFSWISFSGPHYTFDAPEEYWKEVDKNKLPKVKWKQGELEGKDRIFHDSYFGGHNANIDGCGMAKDHACQNYSGEYWERLRISYCANVKLIDDQVGEILRVIKQKYGDNALIIFTADHGEMLGNHGLWGKHNCAYEEVWRIPLLIHYPNQKIGQKDKRIVNSLDFMPTCLGAAGIALTDGDGYDLGDSRWNRKYTFAEGEGYLAVTDGRYKYVHVQKGKEHGRELLDLTEDPEEYGNQIEKEQYQGILAKLREKEIEHLLPSTLS